MNYTDMGQKFHESFNELVPDLKSAILRDYDICTSPHISLIKFSENIICLLENDGNSDSEKKVIRVCRPGYHDKEELENELIWITEIEKYTDINTAGVYKGKNQKMIQQFTSGAGNMYFYSIQSFISGNTIKDMDGEAMLSGMELVGYTAAKLHCMEEKNPHSPNEFKRFTWDIEDTLGERARWGNFMVFPGIKDFESKILKACSEKITDKLNIYGRKHDRYGLIHADLHTENLIVDKDRISLIDFDDCGYGWYLYDLASAVSQQSENINELVKAYLRGYERVRLLSKQDIEMADTFVLLRRLVRLGWMTTRKDNGVIKRDGDIYVRKTLEMAKEYINQD